MTLGGTYTVFRKELADHFGSYRFTILFALITMVSLITVYMAGVDLRDAFQGSVRPRFVFLMLFTSAGTVFSLVQFVGFFGPLIGLILGFDAINRERVTGTLSKLVSQPIYRDSIINGKFLAGVTTIFVMFFSIVSLISGLGLMVLGVVPGVEEVFRVLFYVVISVFYISFWLGLAILFSILFRGIATSALAGLALWIFFSFFVPLGANFVGNAVSPVDKEKASLEDVVKNLRVQRAVSLSSPMTLYGDSAAVIVDPLRKSVKPLLVVGPKEKLSSERFKNPLPLLQSLLVVFPSITVLVAITLICFGVSYTSFMLQEVRSL